MKRIAIFVMLGASFAYARDHQAPQSGTLLQMDSVDCGTDQKKGHQKTQTLLCREYVLQADQIVYRIRPKDDKHPALLPIGSKTQFHIEKDSMKMRVEGPSDKEREYVVVSMSPRTDVQTADNQK
jgi:hypothetical protein